MNKTLLDNYDKMVVKDQVVVIHSDYRDGVIPTTVVCSR